MKIKFNDEEFEVDKVNDYGELPTIEIGREEYILAESHEKAGEVARARWADMAKNDRKEFTCMVGEENLISWCLGECAGPGSTKVNSLEDWLDLYLDTPEEELASYDSYEIEIESADQELIDELGFIPTVAYRTN